MSDHPIRDPETDPPPEILTTEEATGAEPNSGMFKMLAISLVLVVVVLFGLYFAFGTHHAAKGDSDSAATANAAASNTFTAPEPAPKPAPVNGTAGAADQATPH